MSKRIKLNELNRDRFYMTPKELLLNPRYRKILSNDSRLAYSVLKDRLELSRKNNWVNDEGEIYLKFKREKLGTLLDVSINTVTKIMKELEKAELIEEERKGQGKVNWIYICHMQEATKEQIDEFEKEYDEDLEELGNSEEYTATEQTHKFCESRFTDFMSLDSQKLAFNTEPSKPTSVNDARLNISLNDTYSNDTYFNDTTTTATKENTTATNDELTVKDKKPNHLNIGISYDELESIKRNVEKKIGAKITKSTTIQIISEHGLNKIDSCLVDWDKLKSITKENPVGFFRHILKNGYNIPVQQNAIPNMVNFDQREYSAEDFERFYYKVNVDDTNINNI